MVEFSTRGGVEEGGVLFSLRAGRSGELEGVHFSLGRRRGVQRGVHFSLM